jgi:hypothetical protein
VTSIAWKTIAEHYKDYGLQAGRLDVWLDVAILALDPDRAVLVGVDGRP